MADMACSIDLEIGNPVEEANKVVVELRFHQVWHCLPIRCDSLAIPKSFLDAFEGAQDVA